ncbi:ATP-grasp domain-containing protein [Longispora albida]|uniref:ATP-grasp domain-containing protein n=1 Tax=Longispora albida TaxID=203523 RepID=UPI001FE0E271|nr:ATP-grasp domain-containing protein [Longispora albida]
MSSQYRLHYLTGVEPTWEKEYVTAWTVAEDTTELDDALAAARAIHEATPLDGVVTWDEARVVHAAHIAEQLGLPGPGAAAAMRCRDKHQTREALAAAGVPQPRSIQVTSLEEARQAAAGIGYPVVVKPSDLLLSMGVVAVDTPGGLDAAYAAATSVAVPGRADYVARPLVEERVTGYEISVDCSVHEGEVTVLCLARKRVGFPPYCVEIGHTVDAADPLLTDAELLKVLHDAHAALGYRTGNTHTEIMMTPDGPRIIEVNGRVGGDLIPYLGELATGVDTGLNACAVACGQPPSAEPARGRVAGVRFFWAEHDGTVIESVRFDFGPSGQPAAIDQLSAFAKPGSVRGPAKGTFDGRIALATAVGESLAEVEAALDAAGAALRVNA